MDVAQCALPAIDNCNLYSQLIFYLANLKNIDITLLWYLGLIE